MADVKEPLYLVFNLGFRSLRAMVFSATGEVVFSASRSVETLQRSDGVEQDPLALIEKTEVLLSSIAEHPELLKRIRYITFTGSSTCLITTDRSGKPIGGCLLVADRRAAKEAGHVAGLTEFSELESIGRRECDSTQMLPKILWARENLARPADGFRYFGINDFFSHYFTGRAVTDFFNAEKLYYQLSTRSYPQKLFDKLGVPVDALAEVVPPGTTAGPILRPLAERFALRPDCEFIVTSYDAICGFWGSGPRNSSEACDVSGTVTSLRVFAKDGFEKKISDRLFYLRMNERSGILGGSNNLGGGLVEWAKNLFFKEDEDPYQTIALQAKSSLPGARGLIFLPYLLGERAPLWDVSARGVFFGIERFHHRGDFARAILESAAFALRDLVDEIEASGYPIQRIRSSGGLNRLRFASELKATITNKPVLVLDDFETTAIGAFLYMGVATGLYPGIQQAAAALPEPGAAIQPDPAEVASYQKIHRLYQSAYRQLSPLFIERKKLFDELYKGSILEGLQL